MNQNAFIDSALDSFPSLATDESGAWFCVWSTGGSSTPGRWGADRDVVSSYSVDGGITWSAFAAIAANADSDSGEDLFPVVLTDRSGRWLVTWQTDDTLGGTIGNDGDILAVSMDHPTFWADPVFLNTDADSDDRIDSAPQLVTDGAGDWVAIWAGTRTNQSDMYFSRSEDNTLTWTAPSLFTPAATALGGTDPRLATDGNGVWIAVWTLNGIMFSRSTDNGLTWSMPALVAPRQQGDADFAPYIATDHVGNWVLVWGAQRDSLGGDFDLLSSHSMDNGATWEAPIPLKVNASSDLGDDFEPQVATDGNGRWIAVWASNDSLNDTIGRDDDILVAYSLNSGASWSVEQPFNSNAATDQMMEDDFTPQITTDRQGNWLVAWHSKGTLNNTLGDDYDILYSRSGDHGVTWSPVAPLHESAVGDAATDQFVRLGVNGTGEWLAVWNSDHPFLGGNNDPSDSEFDLIISRSSNAGVTWSFPRALNPNATVDSEFNSAANLTPGPGGQWMLGTTALSLLAGGDPEPAFFSLRQPLLAAAAIAAGNGAGLQIANAAITGGTLSLQWNGGSPPFVVQSTSSLGQPGGAAPVWSTLLTTCSFSVIAPVSGQQAFFRVLQSPASGGPVLGWMGDTEYTHAGGAEAVASTFFVPGFGLDADVHVLTSGDLPLTLQKTIINSGGQAVNGGYPAQVEVRGMTFLAVGGSAGYVPGSDLQVAFDCSTTATPSLLPGQMGTIEFTLGGAACAPTLPLSALPCGLYQVTVTTTIHLTGPCGAPGASVTLSDRDFIFIQGPNRVQMAVVQNPNNVRAPAGPPFPNVAICPPNVVGVWPSEELPSVPETAATHQVTISTAPDATAAYFVRAKSPIFGKNGVAQGDLVPLPPQAPAAPLLASGPAPTVLTLNLTTLSGLHGTRGCNSFCGPLIFWDTVNVTITAITTDGCSIAQETLQAAGIYECDSLKLGFP